MGAVDALRESIGFARLTFEQATYDQSVASARAALGDAAFAAAWAEGRAKDLMAGPRIPFGLKALR